jgi:hypothetical protein
MLGLHLSYDAYGRARNSERGSGRSFERRQLGQAKVRDFDLSMRGHKDVRRLTIGAQADN